MKVKLGNIKIINTDQTNLVSSIVLVGIGIVQLIKFLSIFSITVSNILVIFLGIISLSYVFLKTQFKGANIKVLLLILMYSIWGVICYIYNGNMDLVEILWPLGYMSIAILFLNFGIPIQLARIVFYMFSFFIIVDVLFAGNVDEIARNFSRNMVSVYGLLLFGLVILAANEKKASISPMMPLIFAVLCFSAIGRSGIMTSCLAILAFVIFNFTSKGVKFRSPLIIPIVLFFITGIFFIVYYYYPSIINDAISNFRSRGLHSQRFILWKDYFNKVLSSPLNIIFGASINGTPYMDRYSENLHNSFLMLHAKYGIIMIIVFLFRIYKSLKYSLKQSNYYLLVVWGLLIFRMNFDYTNFNDCLDCLMIYLIFYPDFYAKKEKVIKLSGRIRSQEKLEAHFDGR